MNPDCRLPVLRGAPPCFKELTLRATARGAGSFVMRRLAACRRKEERREELCRRPL